MSARDGAHEKGVEVEVAAAKSTGGVRKPRPYQPYLDAVAALGSVRDQLTQGMELLRTQTRECENASTNFQEKMSACTQALSTMAVD
jgi:hypothetical protein